MKRKKGLLAVLLLPVMLFLCTVQSTASDAPYQFRFEEEPEEVADDAYEEYLQNLPPEVRQQVLSLRQKPSCLQLSPV